MKKFKKVFMDIQDAVADDSVRFKIQYLWIYRILGVVSLGMSIVNIFTDKYMLLISTAIFALACLINVLLIRHSETGMNISRVLFVVEIICLFIFFIVVGTPEGFSAIWICLLPACGLLLFGRKNGSLISALMFIILLFFFWTPLGQSALQYHYTDSFMLRFPLLYLAFYAVSLFLETIRIMTQRKLLEMTNRNEYLYLHDALTEIYNRYGFNEKMDSLVQSVGANGIALMILDIDHFKNVNDQYGHTAGDTVLRDTAKYLEKAVLTNGVVCRWGGEEFAVLLLNASIAASLAETIRSEIESTVHKTENIDIRITVSIGVASTYSEDKKIQAKLVKCADHCLYRAKEAGRNRVVCSNIYDD